mmetsp:Transcript_171554/g.545022  ORF Transcript_171554/g.545022 Transcript_171554/m.545022 type:complete len:212 (-) Transcript_171554:179-814(-)
MPSWRHQVVADLSPSRTPPTWVACLGRWCPLRRPSCRTCPWHSCQQVQWPRQPRWCLHLARLSRPLLEMPRVCPASATRSSSSRRSRGLPRRRRRCTTGDSGRTSWRRSTFPKIGTTPKTSTSPRRTRTSPSQTPRRWNSRSSGARAWKKRRSWPTERRLCCSCSCFITPMPPSVAAAAALCTARLFRGSARRERKCHPAVRRLGSHAVYS